MKLAREVGEKLIGKGKVVEAKEVTEPPDIGTVFIGINNLCRNII